MKCSRKDIIILSIGVIISMFLAYVIQAVDANVFAYMQDFEVDDNITLKVSPSFIQQQYAAAPAVGMSIGLRF